MTEPDPGQFDLLPVAFETYRSQVAVQGAEAEAAAIAASLRDFGARAVPWMPGPRNYSATTSRLREWENRADRNSMLLWIGHGFAHDDQGHLYVPGDPDGPDQRDDELSWSAFADHLERQTGLRRASGSWAIVVVEACGASRYVELVHSELTRRQSIDGLLLVGSGNSGGEGNLGQFRMALDQLYTDGSGLRLTTNDTDITLQRLGLMFEEELGAAGRVLLPPNTDRRLRMRLVRAPMRPLTTALDGYALLRREAAAKPGSSGPGALPGRPAFDFGEIGVDFVGREADRAKLAQLAG